jgi:hypothetical protein
MFSELLRRLRNALARLPWPVGGGHREWVQCGVFGPRAVKRNAEFLIQVFLYRREDSERALSLATEADEQAERHGQKTLEVQVAMQMRLTVHLDIPCLTVSNPHQSIVWLGQPDSVQFVVGVPPSLELDSIIGCVAVRVEEIPVGCIRFKLSIVAKSEKSQPSEPGVLGDDARRYRNVFLSYASKDRDEVLKRAQALRALRVKFFQDVLSLEPGDQWQELLFKHIDECDLFLLFWSRAAKESEWVMKEIRHARQRRDRDPNRLPDIHPIVIPPPVDPPDELADLQIGDYLHLLMRDGERAST